MLERLDVILGGCVRESTQNSDRIVALNYYYYYYYYYYCDIVCFLCITQLFSEWLGYCCCQRFN